MNRLGWRRCVTPSKSQRCSLTGPEYCHCRKGPMGAKGKTTGSLNPLPGCLAARRTRNHVHGRYNIFNSSRLHFGKKSRINATFVKGFVDVPPTHPAHWAEPLLIRLAC